MLQAFPNDEETLKQGNGVVLNTEEGLDVPQKFSLSPNYPNPFNPATTWPPSMAAD